MEEVKKSSVTRTLYLRKKNVSNNYYDYITCRISGYLYVSSPIQRIVLFIGLYCKHGPNTKISFGYVVFTSTRSCSKAVLMLICEDMTSHVLKQEIKQALHIEPYSDRILPFITWYYSNLSLHCSPVDCRLAD